MSVIYSTSTALFLKELTSQSKIPLHESDRNLRTKKQLRGVPRLYSGDTSKFAAIPENREHLIKTLLPMVVKLAKKTAERYNANINYDDCISAGNVGAVIATDIYIEKSRISEQPAKLSTYAFSYIQKYINEYCYSMITSLSHGPTKLKEASQATVLQGNQTCNVDGNNSEFFDFANEANLMTVDNHDAITEDIDIVSKTLFSKLTLFDKEVIFLRFGIGSKNSAERQPKEIAKILRCTLQQVIDSLEKSIQNMKNSIPENEIVNVINTVKSSNLAISKDWQRQK